MLCDIPSRLFSELNVLYKLKLDLFDVSLAGPIVDITPDRYSTRVNGVESITLNCQLNVSATFARHNHTFRLLRDTYHSVDLQVCKRFRDNNRCLKFQDTHRH